MNSVVLPLFAVVLACSACSRTDHTERSERAQQRTEMRAESTTPAGVRTSEPVGTTETTGAEVDTKSRSAKDSALIEQGKKEGEAKAKAECDAQKDQQKHAAKPMQSKQAKKTKAKKTSSAAPIPTPTPPSAQTSTTTITSSPPLPAAPPAPTEEPNKSTTLGNSQSGMYTGGAGTYGGTATWGTGTKK